jgi:signal transduction histidine kinase
MPIPAEAWPASGTRSAARFVIPVVLALLAQVPFAVWQAAHAGRPLLGALLVVIAAAGPLLLVASRRAPGPVAIAAGVLAAAGALIERGSPFGPPPIALVFAVVLAVALGAVRQALAAAVGTWLVLLVAMSLDWTAWSPPRLVVATLLLLLGWGAGEFIRSRGARRDAWRRAVAERRESAEAVERVRIARELHDVLSHSLSSIAVQAGVGLHLMDADPQKGRDALVAVRQASTSALEEVRAVLGFLRADEAPLKPAPGLDRLVDLADPARTAGIHVDFEVDQDLALPAAMASAVYRIVQESLTNVVRHSGASRVAVRVTGASDAVTVVVEDDGRAAVSRAPGHGGGIVGMRERAELFGGTFTGGPLPAGGFRVEAVLPRERTS